MPQPSIYGPLKDILDPNYSSVAIPAWWISRAESLITYMCLLLIFPSALPRSCVVYTPTSRVGGCFSPMMSPSQCIIKLLDLCHFDQRKMLFLYSLGLHLLLWVICMYFSVNPFSLWAVYLISFGEALVYQGNLSFVILCKYFFPGSHLIFLLSL